MTKYFTNNYPVLNIYKSPYKKSEVVTQILYGESFQIYKKTSKWLQIKIKEDSYKGYLQNRHYSDYFIPTHKISVLKANIYKFPNKKKKISELSFGSKFKISKKKNNFLRFEKGWIDRKNVKPLKFKEKDIFKKILLFKNIKYKWGGKSFKGIDCSALVQICLNFNNCFCPRDAKDQIVYFKKDIKLDKIKKNDILYWKGHVAVALSKKKLIHAYGPFKKTVIMDIDNTLNRIEKTANLKLKKIKRVK